MGLVISKGNSIHFAISDSNLPNIENTLSFNEKYGGFESKLYCQKFDDGGIVKVQCVSDSAIIPTIKVYVPYYLSALTATLKDTVIIDGDTYYYFEFDVSMASYSSYNYFQIKATQGAITWRSEKIISEDLTEDLANGDILKFEWTNAENTSIVDNTLINYSTGIEFFAYIEAQIKDNSFQGDDELFDNINEKKLIESQLFKARELKTDFIPEFLTDILTIAGKCFIFAINDLRYITDGLPDIDSGNSNLKSLTWSIIHNEVLGFSTDNKGLDVMGVEYIKVKNNDNITSTWSFVIPAGYIFNALICGHDVSSAAAYTIKAGWTVGGSEILTDIITNVPLSYTEVESFNVGQEKSFDTDKTVYITLTGSGAVGKIAANLIWNIC